MTANTPNWRDLDWASVARSVGLKFLAKEADRVTLSAEAYGIVTLSEASDAITVNVSQLPGLKVPKGFTVNGTLKSSVTVPYLQDGVLIPETVLAYCLQCALQGRTIDLQHGITTTGLRATPEQIRLLKTGTMIEVIKDQFYFDEPDPTIKVGDQMALYCLEIRGEAYEDGAEIPEEELEDINWLNDVAIAIYMVNGQPGATIGLMFSDFVIATEQTLEVKADKPLQPEIESESQ